MTIWKRPGALKVPQTGPRTLKSGIGFWVFCTFQRTVNPMTLTRSASGAPQRLRPRPRVRIMTSNHSQYLCADVGSSQTDGEPRRFLQRERTSAATELPIAQYRQTQHSAVFKCSRVQINKCAFSNAGG